MSDPRNGDPDRPPGQGTREGNRSSPHVTMRDVAAAAGVSAATVSRVLSGSQQVDPALRTRVLVSSQRLGYRPNRVARALRARSTGTVGMVVPNIANPFFPGVIQSVEHALHRRSARLLLCDSRDEVEQEAELLQSLLDHRIDGILISVCDRIASRSAVRVAAGLVPVVQVDRLAVSELGFVGVDQRQGIAAMIDHLLDRGCRSFAYVSSSVRISTAAERLDAYRALVKSIDGESADRVYVGDFTLEWGREAAVLLTQEQRLPDAIICANDLIAAGVLQVLDEDHISVPNDVMLTGFDDTILATVAHPQLTTVRQPFEQLGRVAVDTVLAPDDGVPRSRRLLSPTLVIRGSTAAA